MKIAIDARGINWYKGTGIGTYTDNVLKNLINIDKDNSYYLFWSGENFNNFKSDNSKIIMASKKHHRFFEQNYFPNYISKESIDIYHVPQNGIGLFQNINCKTVVTIHDLIPYVMPETVGKGYLLKFLKEVPDIINNCTAIITVSDCSKKDILKFFPMDEDKIFVTPLAADIKYRPLDKRLCKEKIKAKYNIDKDFVLYIGGFSSRKNVLGLIKAFSKVYKDLDSDYNLVIIGSLKDDGNLLMKTVEDLNMKDKIIFTGFVDEDMLPVFYNSCECFIYPSLYEGFGLPPLEAMSCGTPVITSNLSSIPEVTKNAALLINPYDEQSLAEAMGEVMSKDSLRATLSINSLKRAQNFSWEKTSYETLKVYNDILQKTSS